MKITWWHLRSVGNLWILKISYAALALIPFLTRHDQVSSLLGFEVWLLVTVYFANLSLAIANLIYDIECPILIRRFESPNDLYLSMLTIRNLSVKLYPDDNFDGSIDHCKRRYMQDSKSKPILRALCFVFYLSSAILFLLFFLNRSYIVVRALF